MPSSPGLQAPLWEPLHVGVAEEARGKNLHIYWNAPSDDTDKGGQLDLVSAYETNHYGGLILAPIDTMASRSILLETAQDHIPVVVIDDVGAPKPNRYLSYVSNDEQAGGRLAAERVARLLKGRGSIAVIGISGGVASNTVRENAFEDAIAQIAPRIEVKMRSGDANVTRQQQIVQAIITSPDRIDAIVALSASATRGAFYAKIAAKPHSKLPLIGFDQTLLVPLETGDIDAIIGQNTREIGRRAMRNLIAQMHGEPTPGITLIPPILITRDNLHSPDILRLWDYQYYDWSQQ